MSTDAVSLPPLFSRELILSYFLTLFAAVLAFAAFTILPPQIPLWYSIAIPEQQLVPKISLALFPVGMFLVTVIHTLIINKLRTMDATIIKIFSFGTTLVIFLFLVGLVHIVYIFL